jgi:hypothetical protein
VVLVQGGYCPEPCRVPMMFKPEMMKHLERNDYVYPGLCLQRRTGSGNPEHT